MKQKLQSRKEIIAFLQGLQSGERKLHELVEREEIIFIQDEDEPLYKRTITLKEYTREEVAAFEKRGHPVTIVRIVYVDTPIRHNG
jgi:hypothetical protein